MASPNNSFIIPGTGAITTLRVSCAAPGTVNPWSSAFSTAFGPRAVAGTSGVLTMTLDGSPVSGSGTGVITLTDTFFRCRTAVGTLTYTGPANAVIDTVSVTLTDHLARSNTLQIPIQVSTNTIPTAPSTPVVTPSAASNQSMRLDWTASTGTAPINYLPQYKIATDANYQNSPAGTTISLTATIGSLAASTSYNFRVVASNTAGSATSAAVTASTVSTSVIPTAPTNLVVTAITASSLTYTWAASSGTAPISYQPQYRTAGATIWIPFGGTITNPPLTATVTGLAANASYNLSVIAINTIGQTTSAAVTSSTGQTGIPTDVTGTQARPAQDLLNRIGINTHFGNGLYAAFTPTQGVTALQFIGTTLVRDTDNG